MGKTEYNFSFIVFCFVMEVMIVIVVAGEACTMLHVKCLESGTGRVTVRQGPLSQEVSLACHTPLTRLFPRPQHQALLLTVGSSANVMFSGG